MTFFFFIQIADGELISVVVVNRFSKSGRFEVFGFNALFFKSVFETIELSGIIARSEIKKKKKREKKNYFSATESQRAVYYSMAEHTICIPFNRPMSS